MVQAKAFRRPTIRLAYPVKFYSRKHERLRIETYWTARRLGLEAVAAHVMLPEAVSSCEEPLAL